MKLLPLLAAAGLACAGLIPTAVSAKDHGNGHRGGGEGHYYDARGHSEGRQVGHERHERHWRGREGAGWNGGSHWAGYRHDNGHHYGWRNRYRHGWYGGYGYHRCSITWRHHRRARVCW